MKITSTFALLDVTKGRRDLALAFTGFDRAKNKDRIPVTITGFISGRWGNDDGTSIEFCVDVTSVELQPTGAIMAKIASKKPAPKAARKPVKPAKKVAANKRKA